MNKSFDDALLSEEVIRALEFETKLEFAQNFFELYLAPLNDVISKPLTDKGLETIKHIGHKMGGHAEFPNLIPIGETLENLSLEMMKNGKKDITEFSKLFAEMQQIYESEIEPFVKQN